VIEIALQRATAAYSKVMSSYVIPIILWITRILLYITASDCLVRE